jgi:hypothetical protein
MGAKINISPFSKPVTADNIVQAFESPRTLVMQNAKYHQILVMQNAK